MSKGLRTTLWILSSLAVGWTILTLVSLGGMIPMHGMMGSDSMNSMMSGGMSNTGMMVGMTVYMALNAIVMIGMDGVFVYLVVTSQHGRPHAPA